MDPYGNNDERDVWGNSRDRDVFGNESNLNSQGNPPTDVHGNTSPDNGLLDLLGSLWPFS
jgi:hypothetical protein